MQRSRLATQPPTPSEARDYAARFSVRHCNDLRDAVQCLDELIAQEGYDTRKGSALIAAHVHASTALHMYREYVSCDAAPWFELQQPKPEARSA